MSIFYRIKDRRTWSIFNDMAAPNTNSRYPYIIRPVQMGDLLSICEIAARVGPSISLPNHKKTIEQKLERSLLSFAAQIPVEQRLYFFVVEELNEHKILGTGAIEVQAGSEAPFYNFTIDSITETSEQLNLKVHHKIIYLSQHYQEASELGSFYLTKESRGRGLGQLLSRCRALFIAQFPDLFSETIIANMRGFFDEQGKSPFYEAVGLPFLQMDFKQAYFRYLTEDLDFIKELGPKLPIYIDLLPKPVQESVGQVHEHTKPALHILQKEGFVFKGIIDFFDGGPIIEVPKQKLKAVTHSHLATLEKTPNNIELSDKQQKQIDHQTQTVLISNNRKDFRALLGKINIISATSVEIESEAAHLLEVSPQEKIRYYSLQ